MGMQNWCRTVKISSVWRQANTANKVLNCHVSAPRCGQCEQSNLFTVTQKGNRLQFPPTHEERVVGARSTLSQTCMIRGPPRGLLRSNPSWGLLLNACRHSVDTLLNEKDNRAAHLCLPSYWVHVNRPGWPHNMPETDVKCNATLVHLPALLC